MTQKQLLFVNQSNYCVYIWHWWMHQSTQNHIWQRPIKHNGRGSLKLQCDCVQLANKFDWNWAALQCEMVLIKWMQFVQLLLMGVVYWCKKSIGIHANDRFQLSHFMQYPINISLSMGAVEFYSRLNTVVLQSHCLLFHPIQLLHRAEQCNLHHLRTHCTQMCAIVISVPCLKTLQLNYNHYY